ncbi:hypothetical protein SCACP_17050 [Sporomusa carbonis]|uniref:sulfite exporter TauE/SafE family protein n=1 Tax=Sporomusa carbonis TaxID=3076075 RepID=UPI003A5FACE2
MSTILIVFAMGFGAGILSGLLGVGGGVVMVPMLVFILGVAQHMAQGISMLVIIPTAVVSIWQFHKDKLVNYQAAICLAGGAVVGALISANFVQYVPANLLKQIFGVFVIYSGVRMVLSTRKK